MSALLKTVEHQADHDAYAIHRGSLTFRNKLGITNVEDLQQAELVLSAFRRMQGVPGGGYNWEHLQSIHEHLFQDVYDWAGEPRLTSMSTSDGVRFVEPEHIESAMNAVFQELENDTYLMGMEQDEFTTKAAYYYDRINQIHPFRSGNGRVARLFLEELARNSGLAIDWKATTSAEWNMASSDAAKGSRTAMVEILKRAVHEKSLAADVDSNMTATDKQRSLETMIGIARRKMIDGSFQLPDDSAFRDIPQAQAPPSKKGSLGMG